MVSVSVRVAPCPEAVPCVDADSWLGAAVVNGGRFDLARPTSDISLSITAAQILPQPTPVSAGMLPKLNLEGPARVNHARTAVYHWHTSKSGVHFLRLARQLPPPISQLPCIQCVAASCLSFYECRRLFSITYS